MKRPLAVIGFTFLITLAAAVYFKDFPVILLCCIAVVLFFVSLKSSVLRKTKYIPVIAATAAAGLFSVSLYTSIAVSPVLPVQGSKGTVSAVLCDLPYKSGNSYYYTLKAESIDTIDGDHIGSTKMIVTSSYVLDIEPYDSIEAEVTFSDEVSLYDKSKGIMLRGYMDMGQEPIITHNSTKPLYYYALVVRKGIMERINELLPKKEASVVCAVVTGDKSYLEQNEKDNIRSAGLSHIIAVSGFHLSVLTGFLNLLLVKVLKLRKRFASAISIVFILAYMAVTGFSPSAVRSGIMLIICLAGYILKRTPDSLNSLGFASLLILLPNPYAAADTGFVLSFSAALGIILLSDRIVSPVRSKLFPKGSVSEKTAGKLCLILRRAVMAVVSVLSVSFSAFVFTMPAILLFFRQITPYTLISNLLVSFVLPVLIVSAMIMLLLSFSVVFSFLALPFTLICGVSADIILKVSRAVSELPYAELNCNMRFVPLWIIFSAAAAVMLYILGRKRFPVLLYVIALFSSLALCVAFSISEEKHAVIITAADTGDGLSVVVSEDSKNLVLFCGGDYGRYSVLKNRLTSVSSDHISYLLMLDNEEDTTLYSQNLLSQFDIFTAEVYDEKDYKERPHSLISKTENTVLRTSGTAFQNTLQFENRVISSLCNSSCRAVFTERRGFRVLICADGTDCEKLPNHWKICDLLIINGKISNLQLIHSEYIFISDRPENSSRYDTFSGSENVYYTYQGGNIDLVMYPEKSKFIRRETIWQN